MTGLLALIGILAIILVFDLVVSRFGTDSRTDFGEPLDGLRWANDLK